MALRTLQSVTTKLYDNQGRHVADRTDEYFVDKRDGLRHQVQAPRPRPTPPVRPGGPLPPAPPPLPDAARHRRLETYAPPQTLTLVTMVQQGQPLPPLTPPRPERQELVCPRCGCVLCRCKVATPGGLDAIVALQKAQGKRV
jgi:hypothetical protein